MKDFAAAIAHALNNVLTAIEGNLSLLSDDEVLANIELVASVMNDVRLASQRGLEISEELEAVAGKLPLNPEQMDVDVIVQEVLETQDIRGRRLWKAHFFPSKSPSIAHVDGCRLKRAIRGAIGCAVQAMPHGAELLQVESSLLSAGDGRHEVRIAVRCVGRDARILALMDAAKVPGRNSLLTVKGGWGMAAIAGFAKQSNGRFYVISNQTNEVVLELYLPSAL